MELFEKLENHVECESGLKDVYNLQMVILVQRHAVTVSGDEQIPVGAHQVENAYDVAKQLISPVLTREYKHLYEVIVLRLGCMWIVFQLVIVIKAIESPFPSTFLLLSIGEVPDVGLFSAVGKLVLHFFELIPLMGWDS